MKGTDFPAMIGNHIHLVALINSLEACPNGYSCVWLLIFESGLIHIFAAECECLPAQPDNIQDREMPISISHRRLSDAFPFHKYFYH